ncbi:MAG TPA: hypothetical protein VFV05_25955 [Methylomirabilota bacterium]|nr:hypothetical protein [Methylomirabilota bacterium]
MPAAVSLRPGGPPGAGGRVRRKPFKGKCVTVNQRGFRATWNERGGADDLRRNVWLFGGSSIWGSGARDDYTIPSSLSKLLAERFPGVFKVNMGETGYVSTQEVITLLKEVQRGEAPHVVIFHNLLNPSRSADLYAAALCRSARAGRRPRERLPDQHGCRGRSGRPPEVPLSFLLAAEPLHQAGEVGLRGGPRVEVADIRDFFRVVNAELQSAGALARQPDFRDVSDLFGLHAETGFTDWVHTTENGNAMIARRIFQAAAGPRP